MIARVRVAVNDGLWWLFWRVAYAGRRG